jgi:aspartate racemase
VQLTDLSPACVKTLLYEFSPLIFDLKTFATKVGSSSVIGVYLQFTADFFLPEKYANVWLLLQKIESRMKTIGLIGGMSWVSTRSYYQLINQGINQHLGGFHSAKLVLVSVDFAEIEVLQQKGEWQKSADILIDAAKSLEAAGADFFLICTNTMHKVADLVSQAVTIPLLHIANTTGDKLAQDKVNKVALLGTKFTMAQGFYKNRLIEDFSIDVLVPTDHEQDVIHRIIYDELCVGLVNENSRQAYLSIINNLVERGAQGIILGCTEIGLLINSSHTSSPLYDTTDIHARSAVIAAIK